MSLKHVWSSTISSCSNERVGPRRERLHLRPEPEKGHHGRVRWTVLVAARSQFRIAPKQLGPVEVGKARSS